jgi:hypothetical protein
MGCCPSGTGITRTGSTGITRTLTSFVPAAVPMPPIQDFYRRQTIFTKLASGEIAVGVANKLTIESIGKAQAEGARAHADAALLADIRRQQAAEALLQASAQIAASQPPRPSVTTTNCYWSGSNLNCSSVGRLVPVFRSKGAIRWALGSAHRCIRASYPWRARR